MMTEMKQLKGQLGAPVDNRWRKTKLYLPRIAFMQSRIGVRRALIWPGNYEVRDSLSLHARVYREI
jgi:hypothetical protein